MSSATLALLSARGKAINPWFVGAAAVIPTSMGAVSTTIESAARLPLAKQGATQAMFWTAVLVGPIAGPILGGWLVVNYIWRWIFYVNAPVGSSA